MTRRHLTRAALTAAMVPLVQASILACPVCFQINDAHMATSVRVGVGVLIAITVGVVGACTVFFGRVIKRQ